VKDTWRLGSRVRAARAAPPAAASSALRDLPGVVSGGEEKRTVWRDGEKRTVEGEEGAEVAV
jgi:hypothetical protein